MTLGGIAAHLAWVEHFWLADVLGGAALPPRWDGLDQQSDPDAERRAADGFDASGTDALLVAAGAESDDLLDAALAAGGLEQLSVRERHGERASLHWILIHLVEEHARHCGHADLIRESIDAPTGERQPGDPAGDRRRLAGHLAVLPRRDGGAGDVRLPARPDREQGDRSPRSRKDRSRMPRSGIPPDLHRQV